MVGFDDHEIDDGVDLDRDVVVGDDLLRWHLEGYRPQVDLDQPVDPERDDQAETGSLQLHEPPQPEQDAPLVFIDDPDCRAQADEDDENDDAEDDESENAHESLPPLTIRCRRVHVTGHIISALRRGKARVIISALRCGKARVIISALRRGKARVIMRMRPAALPTVPPVAVARVRPAGEGRPRRPRAPASRRRADHPLTWPARGHRRGTPSRWGSGLRARCRLSRSSTPHPRRREGGGWRSTCAG